MAFGSDPLVIDVLRLLCGEYFMLIIITVISYKFCKIEMGKPKKEVCETKV